uniref:Uncharacterized protein n=1 Tax=Arundo donax TaxID=35708 RepID=A0A0A9C4Y1_ARUDO
MEFRRNWSLFSEGIYTVTIIQSGRGNACYVYHCSYTYMAKDIDNRLNQHLLGVQ